MSNNRIYFSLSESLPCLAALESAASGMREMNLQRYAEVFFLFNSKNFKFASYRSVP